jgi:hypothetical protein
MKEYCGYLYANWDFLSEVVNGTENTWGLNSNENEAYPFLAWQNLTHTADITECCITFLGSGTIDDPYQIAALCDLDRLCSNVLLYDKHFVQTANINASATNTWNIGDHDNDEETPPEAMGFLPIGNDEIKFTGTYNGKGYIIDSLSLVSHKNGTIKNYQINLAH